MTIEKFITKDGLWALSIFIGILTLFAGELSFASIVEIGLGIATAFVAL